MDKKSGFVFEVGILGLLLVVVIVIVIFGLLSPARAQDNVSYVCRDTSYPTPRFEFRDLPRLDAHDSWAWLADGVTFDGQTWAMDALEDGTAALMTSNTDFVLRGDADTLPCDVPATPTPAPVVDACPAWAVTANGGKVCLWLLPKAG